MKKYILPFLAVCIFSFSCSSVLDVAPDGRKSLEEIFSNEVTTGAYLNGCYQDFPKYALNNYFWTNTAVALSDDAWEYHTVATSFVYAYKGNITPAAGDNLLIKDLGPATGDFAKLTSWDLYFRNIRRCNVFLNRIDKATVPSEEHRARWKAEAKVLRAYYYLELIGRFGPVPIIVDELPVDFDNSALKKNTFKECVDRIIRDCNEAIDETEHLPWRITVANEAGRMTKAVAAAVKSRAILYAASPLWNGGQNYWDEAERITKEALEQCLANGFELYTTVRNPNFFGDNAYFEFNCTATDFTPTPADKETILDSKARITNWSNVVGTPVTTPAKVGLCPTQELVDSYPMVTGKYVLDLSKPYLDEQHLKPNYMESSGYDPQNPYLDRDPRFYATVLFNGSSVLDNKDKKTEVQTYNGGNCGLRMGDIKRTCTGYYARKHYHPNSRQGRPLPASFRLFRLAELYLNYAEAAAENGHKEIAVAQIKPLRDRVNMPNIAPANLDEARLMVRNERRIEMAYEMNRYYDMRRWTQPDQDMATGKYLTGMWIEKVNGKLQYRRFVIGDIYDRETDTWSGGGWTRACYTNKYLLHPIELSEAARLETATGAKWQNPGW